MLKKMFKGSGNGDKIKIKTLVSMGFNATEAKHALDAFDGNLERATNYLLSATEDQHQHQQQQYSSASRASKTIQRSNEFSAPSRRAGEAAAARAENANRRFGTNGKLIAKKETKNKAIANKKVINSSPTLPVQSNGTMTNLTTKSMKIALKNHPNVKMPAKMKDKSKEEQIMRCAKRLASHPFAVDTLLRAFTFIRQNPENDKYRKIDSSSVGFQQSLEGKPGAMDLIHAMNFVSRPNSTVLILARSRVDPALLYLGISALEQVKQAEEYISSKISIAFEKELKIIQNGENVSEEEEILKRAEFVSKLPSEPDAGAGALMQVSLGEEKIMRKFDGDDILRDVINFIGGHGSLIPQKIISREWCLVDLNQYPVIPIDTDHLMDKTLQSVGCWPSGKLALRPSTVEWKESKQLIEQAGSSRGLGVPTSKA